MAKAEAAELMSAGELKPLLLLSKKQQVHCAIGLTKDKQGLILLDRKAKPQAVAALMKKKAAADKLDLDMTTVRFGKAVVDTDTDAQLVQFLVNKEAPGAMRQKLLEALKKAGFGKCEIRVESSIEDEPEEKDEGEGAVAAKPTTASNPAVAGQGAAPQTAEAASPPILPGERDKAGGPGAVGGEEADGRQAASITQRLTELVKQIPPVAKSDPAAGEDLKAAAMAAQTALKKGDLATATAGADTLERLLKRTSPAGKPGGVPVGSPVFDKARATWVATRKKVESDLEKLHGTLQAVYKGHGVVADLEKTFRSKVEPMMEAFDESLSDKLDGLSKNTDAAAHQKMVREAKQIITRYETFLAGDSLIAKLDDNPFVPLSIEKTLTASLAALSKTVS